MFSPGPAPSSAPSRRLAPARPDLVDPVLARTDLAPSHHGADFGPRLHPARGRARGDRPRASRDGEQSPRIGPNAVLQTLAAIEAKAGPGTREAIRRAAALPPELPPGMIPEAWFVGLVHALRQARPRAEAEAILEDAGARTAAYVARHRIPGPVRGALRLLPPRAGIPILLEAFRRHAWTFAGGGRFRVAARGPAFVLVLEDAPTCGPTSARPAAEETSLLPGMPSSSDDVGTGGYYAAAFEGLLRLASPRVRVREVACASRGAPACRFSVSFHPR